MTGGNALRCPICPRHCRLRPGESGFCRARANIAAEIRLWDYGFLTALALDPVEKKPLRHFQPGRQVLSLGGYGCNLRCPHCQNHAIALAGRGEAPGRFYRPGALADLAAELVPRGNIGLAFTYNEPLVQYEFVRETATLIAERGLRNVLVTNGYAAEEAWLGLLPLIDAMNIDVKTFAPERYAELGGNLDVVRRNLELAAAVCHVEATLLLIPGWNDSPAETEALARWLAGVDRHIPLHITRFFPRHQRSDTPPTSPEVIFARTETARRYLTRVYPGNV
ncbi:MAG: radical SAM protein [Gracilibacteraceae bacterium]|jgi:pyruvate formate lyase activating enzyme|nr:radical SAM protein [Gracilibacteraceae bacterium]